MYILPGTSASLSGLLLNDQSTSAYACKEGKGEKNLKASPAAEVLKGNAQLISIRQIKSCHTHLAFPELLVGGQLLELAEALQRYKLMDRLAKNWQVLQPRACSTGKNWKNNPKHLSVGEGQIL